MATTSNGEAHKGSVSLSVSPHSLHPLLSLDLLCCVHILTDSDVHHGAAGCLTVEDVLALMACVCEDEETGSSSSVCPSCRHCFDVPLILPCSHTLCGRCVMEGAWLDHNRGGVKRVASASEGDDRGVASESVGGDRGVVSSSVGGDRGVVSSTEGLRGVASSSVGGDRGVASSTESRFRGVASSSEGGVKGVASTSEGWIRGVVSSTEGLRGVASSSVGGDRGVASSSQDIRGVASSYGGGTMGVASAYVVGAKGEASSSAEGDRGVASLSQGFRGVALTPGGGVRGIFSTSVCCVLCPNCRHRVELPCFDWSSALTCLPLDPTVTLDPSAKQTHQERRWETDGSTDLTEEEMEQSVSGLLFTLDSSCCDRPLRLSGSALTVNFMGHMVSDDLPQVCASVSVSRGQYYWEIDVCNSALYRIGVMSSCDGRGWWFERRGSVFHVVFDGRRELLPSVPPQLKTVGVFLNVGGASITFHNPVTQEFLAAVPAHFSPPLRPAFQLGEGRLKLRPGLPPPNHVFLSHNSAYRCPGGAGGGRWRRDVSFGSVRAVIQRFEQMSDSDSGLVSSAGSLSSTERL